MEDKQITEEQRQEINKLLSIAKWNLFITLSENFLMFFIMVFISTVGLVLFEVPKDFRICVDFLSFLFIVLNIDKELKDQSDVLQKEVKKVLNS